MAEEKYKGEGEEGGKEGLVWSSARERPVEKSHELLGRCEFLSCRDRGVETV